VLADAGQRIGAAVAIICNLLNPDRLIIGGELSAAHEILLPSPRFAAENVTVCKGQWGSGRAAPNRVLRSVSDHLPGRKRRVISARRVVLVLKYKYGWRSTDVLEYK
jgi:predicted NBD/HSP70 family sugar kinase